MKKIANGLLITAITFLASTLVAGIPQSSTQLIVIGITLSGTLMGYLGQSYAFPSTSILGAVNARDFLKASFVGLGNLIATWGAAAATNTTIDWKGLVGSCATLVIGYFVKQLNTEPSGIPPTK